jgi:hypothetical protein
MLVKVLSAHSQEAIRELTFHVCELLDFYPSSIEIDVVDLYIDGANGMCIDLSQDEFLILLRDYDRMMHTLVHELVHAKQYMKQDLGKHLDARSEEYETSWWEVEARNLTKQIMESYSEFDGTQR